MCRRLVFYLAVAILGYCAGCGRGDSVTRDGGPVQAATSEIIASSPSAADRGPRVRVLGTVQDGGLPHAACSCSRCLTARSDPHRARLITSLALIVPEPPELFLIDATPDIRRQLDRLDDVRPGPGDRVDRRPLDGVLLTHAHIGHYIGLGFFGFEAIHTRDLPVYCTAPMAEYLRANGPWSQLVDLNNVTLRPFRPGEALKLTPNLWVTPIAVPHRDEYADTVGFVVRGPTTSLLYVPDTDSWRAWDPPLPVVLEQEEIDVAILDGTFFSGDELPGRDPASIGHPLIRESLDLLEPLVRRTALSVYFTHLNHSNPALDPDGPERREIERRGFAVLAEGQEIPL